MKFSKRTYIVIGIALLFQLAAATSWYLTSPHLSQESRYFPYIWLTLCGFFIGLFENKNYILKAVILGFLMAILNSVTHSIASYIGVPVDLGNFSDAPLLALIVLPICVAGSLCGAFLGDLIFRFFFKT
ncbi:hypothetical protein ACO0LD_03860 [Undibacterium sp. Ji83W]|uniref:hypothetical protein n=1 Tax=Undibacterium sp. Ji83W TaxID=3413043 RepID=UPI003BF33B3A